MSKNREQQSDRKIFVKWLIIVILAFLGGMIGGFFGEEIAAYVLSFLEIFKGNAEIIAWITLGVFIALNIVVYTICFAKYLKARRMADAWTSDDEVLDEVEEMLNHAMVPGNIMIGCNYFLYPFTMYVCDIDGDPDIKLIIIAFVGILVFIAAMVCSVVLQSKVISLEKELNPEKRGNIFDKHFMKDWEESCDEAQKWIMYKAAYRAYRAAGNVCSVLWCVSVITMISFGTGILPVFCVSAIWITLNATYSVVSAKLESNK